MTKEEKLRAFLKDLTALSEAYDMYIGGCGCCDSPYIDNGAGDTIAHNLTIIDSWDGQKLDCYITDETAHEEVDHYV